MKKSTKGALAAAAAGSLLIGGTGSLAFWTSTGTITGGSIASGKLDMGSPDCGADPWSFVGGGTFGGGSTIVPGDQLQEVCTFTLSAVGDNIAATIGVTTPPTFTDDNDALETLDTELSPDLDVVITDSNDQTVTDIAEAGDYTVTATITVDFPDGATNGTQDTAAALSNVVITATQTV